MSYKKISELNTPNSINGDAKFVFIQSGSTLAGGPGLIKNYIQNSSLNLSPQSPTASTSTATGTLTVSGGIGVSGRTTAVEVYSSGNAVISGNLYVGPSFGNLTPSSTAGAGILMQPGVVNSTSTMSGTLVCRGGVGIRGVVNIGGYTGGNEAGTESTSTSTGSLVVNGGVGVSGRITATNIRCNSSVQSSTPALGSLVVNGGVGIGQNLDLSSTALNVNGTTRLTGVNSTSATTGALVVSGGVGVGGSINVSGGVKINGGQVSSSSSTGSLTVVGGIGISDNAYIGSELTVNSNLFVGPLYETFVVSSEPIIPDTSIVVKVGGDLWTYNGNIWTTSVNTTNISLSGSNPSIFSASNIVLSPGPQKVVKIGGDEVATKNYVDSIAQGLDIKKSVRVATTSRITVKFEGDTTLGGILTTTIDGITLNTGDRVLVKDQGIGIDNREKNGIWVVGPTWTRASDANSSDKVSPGMFVFVEEGLTNADTGWVLTNNGNINLNTTKLDFSQFSGGGTITAGTNLNKSGNSINLNGSISLNSINISGETASTSTGTGAVVINGGLGVRGAVNIGGYSANNTGGTNSTSTDTGSLVVVGGLGLSGNLNTGGTIHVHSGEPTQGASSGALVVDGGVGVGQNISCDGDINIEGKLSCGGGLQVDSTSTSTGTLVVYGGIGTSGNINVGQNINVDGTLKANNIHGDGPANGGNFIFKVLTSSGAYPYDQNYPFGEDVNDGFRVINSDGRDCLRVNGVGAVFSPYGFFINDSVGNYLGAARIYKTNIGNGTSTTFTITHNLDTRDVIVSVYRDSPNPPPGYDTINTSTNQINRISRDQIQLTFTSPPPPTTGSGATLSGGYRVVIMG